VPWPSELLQHQQQNDLAAAAPTIQQLLGHAPSTAITATDLLATPPAEAEADAPSVSLLNGSPSSSSPLQSFLGGRSTSGRVEGLLPDGRAALFDAAGSAAAAALSSAGGESAGQTTLLDLILQRSNSSKLWNRHQQQQQQQQLGPNSTSLPTLTQVARVPTGQTSAAAAAGGPGVKVRRNSSQDTAPGSPVTSAGGNTAWTSREGGSFLRPIPSGSAAAATAADDGGRAVSPMLLQQLQQQLQWLAPASVLVPGLRVRMGVASGVLGDQEDCLNSKVLEASRGEGQGTWRIAAVRWVSRMACVCLSCVELSCCYIHLEY
jgi:hypothetical protein